MFANEAALDGARSGHADAQLKKLLARSGAAKAVSSSTEADEGRLIGHYIEDDALDALALMGMLNGEGEISLTTSTSLNDFEDWTESGDLDFVLVDIYRPDSRSFEDEVQRIRAHSQASIFFITGDEAKFYVEDALEVGAEGVLEKEALTADGLLEVLKEAVKARPSEASLRNFFTTGADSKISKRGQKVARGAGDNRLQDNPAISTDQLFLPTGRELCSVDPARFEASQRYLNQALKAIADCSEGSQSLSETIGAVADAQILLKAFAQNRTDVAGPPQQSVPRVIRDCQSSALYMAKQRGIKLAFHATASVFEEAAMDEVTPCIRTLLKAVIIGSPAGETIKFNGLSNAGGIRLSITSTAIFPFDIEDVLEGTFSNNHSKLASTILMTALCMFLELDSSKVTVFRGQLLHTILIDIQDS